MTYNVFSGTLNFTQQTWSYQEISNSLVKLGLSVKLTVSAKVSLPCIRLSENTLSKDSRRQMKQL